MQELREIPADLWDVHRPRPTRGYLGDLWARREFAAYVALSELRTRQMRSVIGNIWHVLNPLLQIGVYYLIFGLVIETDRGVDNFILFLATGIFLFLFVQRTTIAGARSMAKNKGMMRALVFPRALIPLSSSLTETMAMAGPLSVLFLVGFLTGEPFAARWVLVVPLAATLSLIGLGLAFLAARATNAVDDVSQILPFVFRLLFYGSGVLFQVDSYVENPQWAWIFEFNPLYCAITTARWCMLGGSYDPRLFVIFTTYAVTLPLVGLLWFRRGEISYGRD